LRLLAVRHLNFRSARRKQAAKEERRAARKKVKQDLRSQPRSLPLQADRGLSSVPFASRGGHIGYTMGDAPVQ
jgi:hypothetical protein